MNLNIEKTEEFLGGSLITKVTVSYNRLVELFGEPNVGISGDKKTQCEWNLLIQNPDVYDEESEGIIFIYDWKEDVQPKDVRDWHIGGQSNILGLELVEYILDRRY